MSGDYVLHSERTRAALGRMATLFEAIVAGAVQDAAEAAKASAKGTAAWASRSGTTRGSIDVRKVGPLRARLRAGGASIILNAGSGLYGPRHAKYPIVAVRAKALRFTIGGKTIFRPLVWHPGVKPTHFLDEAATRGELALRVTLRERLGQLFTTGR